MSNAERIPYMKTDGTDWHDSPIRDCRQACSICGYIGGPLQPHRMHPEGGWERADDWSGDRFIVWVPPSWTASTNGDPS